MQSVLKQVYLIGFNAGEDVHPSPLKQFVLCNANEFAPEIRKFPNFLFNTWYKSSLNPLWKTIRKALDPRSAREFDP